MNNGKDTFQCPLPWRHLSVEPSGEVYTCCNAKPVDSIGSLKNSSLTNIWKGEELANIRKQFLNGEIPRQCETCVFQEKNGQVSLRQASLSEFQLSQKDYDGEGKLSFFGLRFGNTCNMSCRICSSGLSTSWYQDDLSLGKNVPKGRISSFSKDQLLELYKMIKEDGECLYFAGGEPFMQPEFHDLLEYLNEEKLNDIKLMVNTNGSTFGIHPEETLDLLGNFKNTYIELSLDDYGKRAEYARKGTVWSEIEKNISHLRSKGFDIFVTPTVSLFNIFYLHDFISYLVNKIKISPKNIRLTVLREPQEYSFNLLSKTERSKIASHLSLLQKELLSKFDLSEVSGLVNELSGIKNALKKDSKVGISEFYKRNNKLDQVRGEDFSSLFPELALALEK